MSAVSGALSRVTTFVTLVALLAGTLVVVVTTRAGAEPAAAPSAPERRYAPGIDPSLDADATLSGLVLGPRGRLRDNVLVEAFSAVDPTGDPVASDLTYEVGDTASHGAYVLHLPAGDYVLRYASLDGATSILEPAVYDDGATVTLAPHEERRLETVVMQDDQGAAVTGRVLGDHGAPAADADVYLVRPGEGGYSVRRWTATASDGTFTFGRVRRGRAFTVAVVPDAEAPVTWLGGTPSQLTATTFTIPAGAPGHDLGDLQALSGVPVTGRVTSPTGPLEAADVALFHLDGHGGAEIVAWDWLEGGDTAYSFPALPGTYTIGVSAYGGYGAGSDWVFLGDTTDLDRATTFTVGSAPYDVGDLVLSRRSIEVTVDVLDPGGVLDPEETEVMLLGTDGEWLGSAYPTGTGDRWSAYLPYGTAFTIAVLTWDSDDWWLLGGTSDIASATFLTAPGSGTTFHAGSITLSGTGLSAPVPALLGQARSGQVLAVETPQWSVADATSSYQWLRDGVPITGAASLAYLLSPADVGHQVSVRVTGRAAGRVGTVTSESRLVAAGTAPTALLPPVVSGAFRRGGTVIAYPGEWDASDLTFAYQWYADGVAVPGARGDRLSVGWSQVGRDLSVAVTATGPGLLPATRTSDAVFVQTENPHLHLVSRRGSVLVTLRAPVTPTGRLTLLDGTRPILRTRLGARDRGRWQIDLGRLRPGRHQLSATYSGNDLLSFARTRKLTVRVR